MRKNKNETDKYEIPENQRTDYILEERPEEKVRFSEDSLKVTLSEKKQEEFLKYLCEEIDAIDQKQQLYFKEFDIDDDQYDGILEEKTFPFEDSSNIAVPMTPEKVDAVATRAIKAIVEAEPIWIVEPTEESDIEACEKQERFLDFIAKNKIDYEEVVGNVAFDATLYGTGILELTWAQEVERVRGIGKYAGKKGLKEFLASYPDAQEKYPAFVRRLEEGETIDILEEYDDVVYNAAKPIHIPIRDFVINPDNITLKKASLYGKRFSQTGNELRQKAKDNYYDDISSLTLVKESTGEDAQSVDMKFLKREFQCYRLVVSYAFEEGETEQKYLVELVYDSNKSKKQLLRIVQYPYWHNQPCFIPFHITRRKRSFYREGIAKMLRYPQLAADVLFNLGIDIATIQAMPSFKARRSAKSVLARELNKGWYPGVIFWVDDIDNDLKEIRHGEGNIGQLQNLEQTANRYGELRSGISPYMSGKESSTDKDAPARKTAILLNESNMRVGAYIKQLQRSNREVAFQLIQLYYQFMPAGQEYRILNEAGDPAFPKINRDEIQLRADYRPHGSADTLNRVYEQESLFQNYERLRANPLLSPEINPPGFRYLTEQLVKAMGGDWDKKASKIVLSDQALKEWHSEVLKMALQKKEAEEKKQMQARQANQQGVQQGADQAAAMVEQLLQQGVPPEEAKRMVQQQFDQMHGQPQVSAPGGQAPEMQQPMMQEGG